MEKMWDGISRQEALSVLRLWIHPYGCLAAAPLGFHFLHPFAQRAQSNTWKNNSQAHKPLITDDNRCKTHNIIITHTSQK